MQNTNEIKELFRAACEDELPQLIKMYEADERAGVVKIVAAASKKLQALQAERERSFRLQEYERKYTEYTYICGIDEVGRGPLAGPVVAGAVILPKNCDILYINDSKQLSEKKRGNCMM